MVKNNNFLNEFLPEDQSIENKELEMKSVVVSQKSKQSGSSATKKALKVINDMTLNLAKSSGERKLTKPFDRS